MFSWYIVLFLFSRAHYRTLISCLLAQCYINTSRNMKQAALTYLSSRNRKSNCSYLRYSKLWAGDIHLHRVITEFDLQAFRATPTLIKTPKNSGSCSDMSPYGHRQVRNPHYVIYQLASFHKSNPHMDHHGQRLENSSYRHAST